MYIPNLIFKTPAYTLGIYSPLCYVAAALLPSKMCEDETGTWGASWKAFIDDCGHMDSQLKLMGFRLPAELWKDVGEGNGKPLQYSCLENPMDRGAWWAAVEGVAQSQTRLKRLSSSSGRLRPHHLSRGKKMALRMKAVKIRKLSEPHDGC